MPLLTEMAAGIPQRVMLFGPPKSGKTRLAAALAEHFKINYVDLENGTDVLFSLPTEWHPNINVIKIPDTRDFPIAAETCAKMTKGPVDICEEHGKVSCMVCKKEAKPSTHLDLLHTPLDTITIFDTATQLANSIQAHIVKDKGENFKPGWDEYNLQGYALDRFFSRIQVAPYHVIVISHVTEGNTKGKKKMLVPMAGTANFSGNVAKYFNHVIYTEVKNRKHRAYSSSTFANNVVTGSRLGSAIEDAPYPDLVSIFKPELAPPPPKPGEQLVASDVLTKLKEGKK
jgi:hypothetical protein